MPEARTDARSISSFRAAFAVFRSKRSPRTIAAIAGTSWLARAALGPLGFGDLVAAGAAVAVWPFFEHQLHHHLLHMKPREIFGTKIDPHPARAHRAHHREPHDVDQILLPFESIVGAVAPAIGVSLLALGPRRGLTFFAAFSSMALLYEWTHLWVHTSVKPTTARGRLVQRNHLLHHFRSEHHWFAFTVPEVDAAFGTAPDPASVPRSKTAMDLHGLGASEGEGA